MNKICLISSSGGHFEQLLMLLDMGDEFKTFIVTEKTQYNIDDKKIQYFVPQVNRKQITFIPQMLKNFTKSSYILLKEKPDVIISTGVLAAIPMMILGRLFNKKVIYIESFAKINNPTITGKIIYKYKIANRFYVQWESMKVFYPEAICLGGIY